MQESVNRTHNIIIENRRRLNLSGVINVDSFDDSTVALQTQLGALTIRGEELHISGFNVDTGDMMLDGHVFALVYTADKSSGGGFISKLFR